MIRLDSGSRALQGVEGDVSEPESGRDQPIVSGEVRLHAELHDLFFTHRHYSPIRFTREGASGQDGKYDRNERRRYNGTEHRYLRRAREKKIGNAPHYFLPTTIT